MLELMPFCKQAYELYIQCEYKFFDFDLMAYAKQ